MKNLLKFSVQYLLLLTLFGIVCFSSCQKKNQKCDSVKKEVPKQELLLLEQYLQANDIKAQKDDRGFYYQVLTNGSSKHPSACSDVMVDYVGKLINNQVFDKNPKVSFNLTGVIIGWQMGLPLIGEGGTIVLYLPPSLAYGIKGIGDIPSNAITIFDITLLKVNN